MRRYFKNKFLFEMIFKCKTIALAVRVAFQLIEIIHARCISERKANRRKRNRTTVLSSIANVGCLHEMRLTVLNAELSVQFAHPPGWANCVFNPTAAII